MVTNHRPEAARMGLDVSKTTCDECSLEFDTIRMDRLNKHMLRKHGIRQHTRRKHKK